MKLLVTLLLVSCLLEHRSFAQAPAADAGTRQKNSDVELKRLRRDKPDQYAVAVALVQMQLSRFGYLSAFDGVLDERTKTALREYQRANKLDATGELSIETLDRLEADRQFLDDAAVSLPTKSFYATSDYLSVKGTWIIEGQAQGIPLQTSEIECIRSSGECVEAKALLREGFLSAWLEHHEIDRWDENEIITRRHQKLMAEQSSS